MTVTDDALSTDWMGQISKRMRARRFERFAALAGQLPRPLTILDVGGRAAFWAAHGWADRSDVRIITGNIEAQEREYGNIEPIQLDATDMSQFADKSFSLVFSNSVIEHLYTWDNQVKMANEVQRVGKAYWVQTPNYWFPMEPHFRVLGWQWLPESIRVAILRRRRCGWRGPCTDPDKARLLVQEVRLVGGSAMRALFPQASILAERWCGLTKSWIAVGGDFSSRPNSQSTSAC